MKSRKIELWQIALVVCIAGFLFCGGKALAGARRTWQEKQANRALARQVRELSAGEEKFFTSRTRIWGDGFPSRIPPWTTR